MILTLVFIAHSEKKIIYCALYTLKANKNNYFILDEFPRPYTTLNLVGIFSLANTQRMFQNLVGFVDILES